MRVIACILALFTSTAASAQSGFFMGGYADGVAQARQLELQRRALELDAYDGGNRYNHLRTEQQLDELNEQLRRNNDLLEQQRWDRLIRGR